MTTQQTLQKIIKKHKLDRINDWATIRVAWEILTNSQYNRDLSIGETNTYMKPGECDPQPLDDTIPTIQKLFQSGYEIAFSQSSNQGDEGDPLYLCFLLKPEHKDNFHAAWDKHPSVTFAKNNTDPGLFFNMTYLLKHPTHFTQIWAGPY